MVLWRAAGRIAMLLALVACFPCPAWAHKLNVFAHVEGRTIRGNAYFPGNVPAREIQVMAVAPNGRELGRTKTDQEGNFALEIRERCDTKIVAASEDGHGAEYLVHAAEMPADLPAAAPSDGPPVGPPGQPAVRPSGPPSIPGQELLGEIQALRAQVVELRGQVYDYEQRLRFRDVLGGLGYILGLAGVACYLLSLRRQGIRD
jgi:nickel transport protein